MHLSEVHELQVRLIYQRRSLERAAVAFSCHAVLKDPASYIAPAKYPIIHQAALAACDGHDGLKDGLIDDPRKCDFDPKVLLCKAGDGPECLTAPQADAAKKIYSPAVNPRTGKELFSSLVPGTELGWGVQAQGPEPSANIYDQYRYVVFKDAKWDWKTFNFDSDVAKGDLPENVIMYAIHFPSGDTCG